MTPERFWLKVHKAHSGCWLWQGPLIHGYARFLYEGRTVAAHRYAYELLVGPIPEGMVIDHLCRVTNCVNPDHLEAVTRQTNTLRGATLAALNVTKTHCPKGHAYDASNTAYWGKRRKRFCRTCDNARRASA